MMPDTMTLLLWLAKATALLLLAMGLTLALRRAPAGARYLVWLATLVALLLTPAMSAWSPIPVRILPHETPALVADAPASAAPVAPTAERVTPVAPSQSVIPSSSPVIPSRAPAEGGQMSGRPFSGQLQFSDLQVSIWAVALWSWAAIAALLLAWLGVGSLAVRRIMRSGRTVTDDSWLTPLYETADRLELDRVPRLVMSNAIEMPFACSILKPTIVLPMSAEHWSDERRRVVLFHELAHIGRRDLVGHTLGRVACVLYWFHPLVWSAARQLRAESERACDDLVLACGARPSDYANHLLDIVTSVRAHGAPATALPMADKREFEGRMLAILDPALHRSTPSRAQKLMLTLGLGSVALTIAAAAPAPRVASVETQQVAQQRPDPQPQAGAQDTIPPRKRVRAKETDVVIDPAELADAAKPVSVAVVTEVVPKVTMTVVNGLFGGPLSENAQQPDTALLGRILRTDRDGVVRKVAAWALRGRRDGVPLLVERLRVDTDHDVRETAAWGLAGFTSDDVLTALATALRKDESAHVRGTAAWALGHSQGRADVNALAAALGDENEQVRHTALWALGHQGLSTLPSGAADKLKDEDEHVRRTAAWLVAEVRDRSALPAVREAFMRETDRDVQHALFRALLFFEDRSQAVIDRAMASDNPDLRARAVRMIAGLGPGVWPWPWPWPQPRPNP